MSLNSSGVENEPRNSGNEERSLVKAEDFIEIWKIMLHKYCRQFLNVLLAYQSEFFLPLLPS